MTCPGPRRKRLPGQAKFLRLRMRLTRAHRTRKPPAPFSLSVVRKLSALSESDYRAADALMRPFFVNRARLPSSEERKNATACNFQESGNCGVRSPDGGSRLHCTVRQICPGADLSVRYVMPVG